jgi:hypothetical protein
MLDRSVATRAVAAIAQGYECQVSKVPHLDDLDGVVGESVEQVLPPAADSVVAVIAALRRDQARYGLHVILHKCQIGTEIASVQGVNSSVSQLHVLLRHRPPSIPPPSRQSRRPFVRLHAAVLYVRGI